MHLLIGIGGTGGKVIRAYKEADSYSRFVGGNTPVHQVNFLYLDTSNIDLQRSQNWLSQADGSKIGLPAGETVSICNPAVIDNHAVPDVVRNILIGEPTEYAQAYPAGAALEAGNQMRRYGWINYTPFAENVVNRAIDSLQGNYAQQEIHLIAGLNGGTGSGVFLSLLAHLRRAFDGHAPDGRPQVKLHLYLVMHPCPNSRLEKNENFYANAYAALAELNNFILPAQRAFAPISLFEPGIGQPIIPQNSYVAASINLFTFNRANNLQVNGQFNQFQFSEVDEEAGANPQVNVYTQIGDYLHKRLNLLNQAATLPQAVTSVFNNENNAPASFCTHGQDGIPALSTLFFTHGIQRAFYPEDEIAAHYRSAFMENFCKYVAFNNKGDDGEYCDRASSNPDCDIDWQELGLTIECLREEESVYLGSAHDEAGRRRFSSIGQLWDSVKDRYLAGQLNAKTLTEDIRQVFSTSFCGIGVTSKYEERSRADVVAVRNSEWMLDYQQASIKQYLLGPGGSLALVQHVLDQSELRLKKLQQQLANDSANRENTAKECKKKIAENLDKLKSLGWLAKDREVEQKLLQANVTLYTELYKAETFRIANGLASVRIEDMRATRLGSLKALSAGALQAAKDCALRHSERRARRCPENDPAAVFDDVSLEAAVFPYWKIYNPNYLRQEVKGRLRCNSASQRMLDTKAALHGVVGNTYGGNQFKLTYAGLRNFFKNVGTIAPPEGAELAPFYERVSQELRTMDEERMIQDGARQLLGKSIVQCITEYFSPNSPQLDRFVTKFHQACGTNAVLSQLANNNTYVVSLMLPQDADRQVQWNALQKSLNRHLTQLGNVCTIANGLTRTELVAMVHKTGLTLDSFWLVKQLHAKYKERLHSPLASQTVHTNKFAHGRDSSYLWDPFPPAPGEHGTRILPYVWLALASGKLLGQDNQPLSDGAAGFEGTCHVVLQRNGANQHSAPLNVIFAQIPSCPDGYSGPSCENWTLYKQQVTATQVNDFIVWYQGLRDTLLGERERVSDKVLRAYNERIFHSNLHGQIKDELRGALMGLQQLLRG